MLSSVDDGIMNGVGGYPPYASQPPYPGQPAPPPYYAPNAPYPQAAPSQPGWPPAPYGYGPPPAPQQPPVTWQPPQPAPPPAPAMPLAPAASPADPYASARRQCIDATNGYRARLGLAALSARSDKSACSDVDARGDATNGTVHGASGRCDLSAQNECPGWNGPADKMVAPCLASMFAEGPGEPYAKHGHYINMTSGEYHSLACGFYDKGGQIWMVQNYFR